MQYKLIGNSHPVLKYHKTLKSLIIADFDDRGLILGRVCPPGLDLVGLTKTGGVPVVGYASDFCKIAHKKNFDEDVVLLEPRNYCHVSGNYAQITRGDIANILITIRNFNQALLNELGMAIYVDSYDVDWRTAYPLIKSRER